MLSENYRMTSIHFQISKVSQKDVFTAHLGGKGVLFLALPCVYEVSHDSKLNSHTKVLQKDHGKAIR